ncbi:hypothetical protein HN018_13120 [Lichenicola cladoniae]|uniref:ParG n=1 Tax=Lichenicola cladoniae TaxID=1484109 RepID=A0A6M8HR89_9PROT|nr:plasmid partition protein ParG [Lichenicola cladoniae]NPD68713.1 hypothetical protein [Acetobacteraceae bacterium]QKE90852.1 hypothetical protein HN018_13120 [Lichenicola cladoniae]
MTRFPKPNRQHDDDAADRFVKGIAAPAPAPAPAPAAKPDLSRPTVDIPTELHRQFKARCATDGTTMGEVVAKIMQSWLTDAQTKS